MCRVRFIFQPSVKPYTSLLVDHQVNERFPKELERRQKRVQALQDAFSNGVNTEMDLQRLQGQVRCLCCVWFVCRATECCVCCFG